MDGDNLETKCENLMNIVVESRKRFGKMSMEYEQKSLVMENKMLNMKIEAISNYRFKPKYTVPSSNTEDLKEIDNFITELLERKKRIESLKLKLKNTQCMVLQLKNDNLSKTLKKPLTMDAIFASVKEKHLS